MTAQETLEKIQKACITDIGGQWVYGSRNDRRYFTLANKQRTPGTITGYRYKLLRDTEDNISAESVGVFKIMPDGVLAVGDKFMKEASMGEQSTDG